MAEPVTLDFSKAKPIQQAKQSVTLDFSKAQPIASATPSQAPAPVVNGTSDQYLQSAGLPTFSDLADVPKNLATGAAQGAASTVGNSITGISTLLNKLPLIGKYLAPQEGINALQQRVDERSRPENMTQAIGKGGEQIGEMLLPSGLEEKAVSALPKLGKATKYIAPLVRIGEQAAETGVRNASQGGSFNQGAAGGAIGGTVGEIGKAVAPALAETALGVTNRLRGRGKTIGEAVLNETTGVAPKTILEQSGAAIRDLTSQLETAAQASSQPAFTTPALQVLSDEVNKAAQQNNGAKIEQLTKVWDQLTKEYGTNNPIPTQVTPEKILNLKRGIGDLVKSWSPEQKSGIKPIIQRVYGALDGELDRTVPGAAELNQRISSLIPAKDRANRIGNNAGTLQKVSGRLAAHTGALAGAAAGGYLGAKEGGTGGAIKGSLAGLVIPELLTNPTAQMTAARLANSPVAQKLGVALGLQLLRPSYLDQAGN